MTNPLLQREGLPSFPEIQAEHMLPAIESVVADARAGIEKILISDSHTYDSLVHVREELESRINEVWSPISHMNSVVNSEEIRTAHQASLEILTAYHTEIGQNKGLYHAYQSVRASQQFEMLSIEQQKVIDNALRDFKLSGIDLPEVEQSEFATLTRRLSELSSRFNNNVLDATQAWTKLLVYESDLPGIPASLLGSMREAASLKNQEGFLVTLDMPCYNAILTYCDDRDLRHEVYIAYGTRASNRGPHKTDFDNSSIIQAILTARLRQARLLGFDSFAELSVQTKMARTPKDVIDFLSDLGLQAKPAARRELAEIEEFAAAEGAAIPLQAWDIAYYAQRLKKKSYDISDEELRPFFPANQVLTGMFNIVRRLFAVEIFAVDDMPVWHEEVTTYEIQRDGQRIARFYVDLYARENKRGGAWMADCRVRRRTLEGQLCIPVAFLTCNFNRPVGDQPALLTHGEVVTLFHEFGHGLHHMLTTVEAAEVSGTNGVAWDAVELPSQFFENFCWQAEGMSMIANHYETNEPLNAETLNRLLAAKNFQSAMLMARQLEFGIFDFKLHVGFDPQEDHAVERQIEEARDAVAVVRPPEEYAFQNGFSHIFGGGYAAGYYSYKWAEVLSADAFAKFLEEGIFNRQTAEKFLSCILEKGGSQDALDLFVEFRGREPQIEALLRQDGISA